MSDIATGMLDAFAEGSVQELINLHAWMKEKKFILLTEPAKIDQYIDLLISKGLCALDLETTGLNLRVRKDGSLHTTIVGVCLAWNSDEAVYIPVGHEDKEFNLPIKYIIQTLKRLVANCRCIFHNVKYDGTVLRNYGIIIDDEDKYEDTFLMAAVEDASRRKKGLKELSDVLLKRPMIEIDELGVSGNKKSVVAFNMVPPQVAVYYAASDAMNTFGLYEYFKARLNELDPQGKAGPWAIYKIEKRCMFVTMEMERNLIKINVAYYKVLKEQIEGKIQKIVETVYDLAGHEFDINSPKQLGIVLFDELKVRYPMKEKSATGQYLTNEKVLSLLDREAPIVKKILSLRSMEKLRGTYIDNFINNADDDDCIRFQLNQVQADTGRFSASGGDGIDADGFCGVQCQNLPTYDKKDPDSVDVRKGIIARPGYKILTIDYSGEELRIAANFSKEPKWIYEFNKGSADLHTMTAKIVSGKGEVSKEERSAAKTLNFHTIYGGGPQGFAVRAKIPLETAKKIMYNFFKGYNVLASWIKSEQKAARKRGYSLTAFGRRRPLKEYYDSPDFKRQVEGDRKAVNSRIQGCLCPWEMVLTNQGYLTIVEAQKRKFELQNLLVWTGTEWADFEVCDRGEAQLARVILMNGMFIDCDTRHEVLIAEDTGYRFEHYNNITTDTNVCVSIPTEKEFGSYPTKKEFSRGVAPNSKNILIKDKDTWDFIAYFLGCVTGDGWVRTDNIKGKYSVTLAFGITKINNIYPKIKRQMELLGLSVTEPRRIKGAKGESYSFDISSKALVSVLEYLGYEHNGSREKRVPQKMFESPISMRKAFLKGYFDTDGCKKAANKYSIHTPNYELLREVQLLGWTLGLSSVICFTGFSTYRLDWSGLAAFEDYLGLPKVAGRNRRCCSKMALPKFLYREIYNKLKNCGIPMRTSTDRTLLCKLNKNKNVTVQTALRLLKEYGCETSQIYFHYPLRKKEVIDRKEITYTLSVFNEGHRFDSAGIISKNTGADILKIALWRVWKWKNQNGFTDDDIRILFPVHDEIVYEVKEEKLGFFVEHIRDLMVLRDLTDKLKWEVPLEIDAEYGDSFSVDHDYYKEKEKLEKEGNVSKIEEPKPVEHKKEEETLKKQPTRATMPVVATTAATVKTDNMKNGNTETLEIRTMTTSGPMQKDLQIQFLTMVEKLKEDKSSATESVDDIALKDDKLAGHLDTKGFYIYQIADTDYIRSLHLKHLFEILDAVDGMFVGPRCRIKIIDSKGEVLHKNHGRVAVDAFLALCNYFHI